MNTLVALLLATAQDVDAALDALAAVPAGNGAAYEAARANVVALGAGAVPALRVRGAADRWTADGWVRALAAEACRARLEDPELAAAVDRPRGLDPEHYRRFRRPEPMSAPELARRGAAAVPLLLERWRWTFSTYPFSAGADGEAERENLRQAILFVAGQTADRRARHLLGDVLANAALPVSWRRQAALSLGSCAGTVALPALTRWLDGAGEPADLREACARALGRVPDPAAVDAIRSRLGDRDTQVRQSLLSALGWLGSEWGWKARGPDAAALGDRVRQGCADALVESLRNAPEEIETVQRALALTAWSGSRAALEKLGADAGASPYTREAAREALRRLKP